MAGVIRGVTAVFDVLLAPLAWLSPAWGLVAAAIVSAAFALLVVKRFSDQAKVKAAKNGLYAALLEMRLFNDDLRAIFRAQGDVFRFNARYLRAALVPVLWLIVPFGLLVSQLDAFYAYDGLPLNQPAVLAAHVRAGRTIAADAVAVSLPAAIRADSPALWFPATRELVWRLEPAEAGRYDVTIHDGSEAVTKTVVVSDRVARRSPARGAGGWTTILEPASEPPLPSDSVFDAVSVSYADRDLTVFGWHLPWLVVYGALVIVFGFAIGRVLRIEI